jgi:hypothetical protein
MIKRSWISKIVGIFSRVSGWLYSGGMDKHEVVNEILEYLDTRRTQLSNEMAAVAYEMTTQCLMQCMKYMTTSLLSWRMTTDEPVSGGW